MDAVDASTHYEVTAVDETPALLSIILDTNPRAWAALSSTLPLSKAVANLLVFANSHLALSSANQVAVVASHCNRAVWLYPSPKQTQDGARKDHGHGHGHGHDHHGGDVDMADPPSRPSSPSRPHASNKFPQFREIETTLLQSVRDLVASTTTHDLDVTTTLLSGALTLALAHINKTALAIPAASAAAEAAGESAPGSRPRRPPPGTSSTTASNGPHSGKADADKAGADAGSSSGTASNPDGVGLHARILVLSVSDASAAQYIPTMNAVFAAAHAGVAIDVLALRGAATFLQQAAYITRGTFVRMDDDDNAVAAATTRKHKHPPAHGLLATLMLSFSAASARDVAHSLVPPGAAAVDFRAACFCHRRVVDTGFVCSICLSIFCEAPGGAAVDPAATVECLTCGSQLRLGNYGARPAVVPRSRKKKKRRLAGREDTASAAGTPAAS